MVFPAFPTATHKLFAYVTSYPRLVKTVLPNPFHTVPFVEVAMLFELPPELPTATQKPAPEPSLPYATRHP